MSLEFRIPKVDCRSKWILLLCGLFASLNSYGEFRFPMPEFSTGYEHPPVHVPSPSNTLAGWDIAVLVGCLALASYLVIKRRKRREIFLLTLFALIFFGFWRKGCVCSVGSVQNIMAGIFDSDFGVPLVVLIFFAAPLVFALFFGRVFCAAVCPLGAIQEAVAVRPVKVPPVVEKVLSIIPYIYLGLTALSVAMGAGFIICQYDPFVGFFRLGAGFNMVIFGLILLLIGIFVARPYCRFLCPYGVLLNWCSRLSRKHTTITPSNCIPCDLCADSCPYNAILEPSAPEPSEDRRQGKSRLGKIVLLVPLMVLIGIGVGSLLREPLSRMHPTVRLAERVAGEELGRYSELTIDSETFRSSDQPVTELYDDASEIKQGFGIGGRWLGGFIGLVIGFKLIAVSIHRTRTGYEPDRGTCFSCGRCYKYCPVEE